MLPLLFLACQPPSWTADSAVAPHRARLDDDADGRVNAAEYERRLWNGPPFATADQNGDGDLSSDDLAFLIRVQSPTTFDASAATAPIRRAGAGVTLPPAAQRDVWELLVWMADALRKEGKAGPEPAAVAAAVHSGSVQSPESRGVLDTMRPGWLALGWAWPEGVP